eukprot:364124-Chlamydomonas_euryale.AAC.3
MAEHIERTEQSAPSRTHQAERTQQSAPSIAHQAERTKPNAPSRAQRTQETTESTCGTRHARISPPACVPRP